MVIFLHPQVQPLPRAVGNDDVESLDRFQRQSQHGVDSVRADLWLPHDVPMGSAAAFVCFGRTRTISARCIYRACPYLLVQGSIDGSLFSHAVLRCGTCWGICRRMKLSSAEDFRPIDNPIRTLWLLVDIWEFRLHSGRERVRDEICFLPALILS